MKRKVLVLATLVTVLGATQLKAQLNVGSTAAPDASAILQLSSTTQGLRMPNVALTTTTTFAPVVTPTSAPAAIGMSVYNTTAGITSSNALYPATGVGVYTWNGTGWVTASGVAGATGTNIYNSNGTLTGARTVTQGANSLVFNGSNTLTLAGTGTGGSALGLVDAYNKAIYFDLNSHPSHTDPLLQFRAYSTANISRIGTSGSNLGFYTQGADSTSTTPAMYVGNTGNVGIGNTAPGYKLDVTGQTINVTNTGGAALYRASNGTSDLRLQNNNGNGFVGMVTNNDFQIFSNNAPRITALASGLVGINTALPTSALTVNGAATNLSAYNAAAGTTIDFSLSNLAYTTSSPTAFTLTNLKDGGTYTLAVKGTTSGTASFTASGFTVHAPVDNGASTSGKQSVYTLLVIGADVYMSWITGY